MDKHASPLPSDRPVALPTANGPLNQSQPLPARPVLTERGYSLTVLPGTDHDFTVWLNFPGQRGPAYPLCGHRAIAEFREMLTAIDPAVKAPQYWDGALFVGVAGERDQEWDFMFRGRKDGICFPLSASDWAAVRELFRRAWDMPKVRDRWLMLTSQGETR